MVVSAIVLGLLQGVSEFLPISSSGHLIIARLFFPLPQLDPLVFDVTLHLGTLLAVMTALWGDLVRMLRGVVRWIRRQPNADAHLAGMLLAATVPAGVFGWFLEDQIETVLRSPGVVAATLAVIAVAFLLIERRPLGSRELGEVRFSDSVVIGLAQALALIPGVSRSGITMVAGLRLKLKREAAARFSFLLSVPIIFGAALKQMVALHQQGLEPGEGTAMLVGVISAAVAGFASIRLFLRFMRTGTLRPYAYYRLLLAAAVIVFLLVR